MRTSLLNGRYPPTDWRVQVCVGDGIPADPFTTSIILFFFQFYCIRALACVHAGGCRDDFIRRGIHDVVFLIFRGHRQYKCCPPCVSCRWPRLCATRFRAYARTQDLSGTLDVDLAGQCD